MDYLRANVRDPEEELVASIRQRQSEAGDPLDGLYTLARKMETDEDEQFDVDLSIFDFMTFKAVVAVFEWRSSTNPYQSDLPSALVTMSAEWRKLLQFKYDGRRIDEQPAFRSRLLVFTLLFTHRLNHDKTWTNEDSINGLREKNKRRGTYWQRETLHSPALRNAFDTQSEFPLSDGALAENRHELASALGMPQDKRRWVTDVEGTPSLYCLLPLFVELTAARTRQDDEWMPTKDWFNLAGQFMLQAVIEEYLRNGAFGEEPFNTIFAFGCPGTEVDANEDNHIEAMRTVFCDGADNHEQVHGWAKIKRRYIKELLPESGSSTTFLQAIERAQVNFPYVDFETQMMDFLMSLHVGMVKPDLVMMEEGRITINGQDLSEEETRGLYQRAGIDQPRPH